MGREQNTTGEILLYNHGGEKEFVSVVFQDETFWLAETDRFLSNNRRKVPEGKGHISREDAAKKVGDIYAVFRKKQDADYISEFDRQTARYLKGETND